MRGLDEISFLSRSLPANNLLRRVLDVLILDREKIKEKYISSFGMRVIFSVTRFRASSVQVHFFFFFFEGNVELFFKCSGFFFIVHNLIIKMFLAKEWFSFPLLVKIFHALWFQIPWQCYYLFLIWALNCIECGCASGYKYKFISGGMIGKWIDRIKCFSSVISCGSYSDVYICSMDFLLTGIERINSNGKK